jgi:hypothetical protein
MIDDDAENISIRRLKSYVFDMKDEKGYHVFVFNWGKNE